MTWTDYLTVPGDALPGLLDGWTGPVRVLRGDQWLDATLLTVCGVGRGPAICWADGEAGAYCLTENVRLDLRRSECRDRVARVLAAAGQPVWYLLDAERNGTLTPDHIGACLGWSVLSVARGGGVLRGVGGEWRGPVAQYDSIRKLIVPSRPNSFAFLTVSSEFPVQLGRRWALEIVVNREYVATGPELGPEGRACADRAALAAGYALRDGDALTMPDLPAVRP